MPGGARSRSQLTKEKTEVSDANTTKTTQGIIAKQNLIMRWPHLFSKLHLGQRGSTVNFVASSHGELGFAIAEMPIPPLE